MFDPILEFEEPMLVADILEDVYDLDVNNNARQMFEMLTRKSHMIAPRDYPEQVLKSILKVKKPLTAMSLQKISVMQWRKYASLDSVILMLSV